MQNSLQSFILKQILAHECNMTSLPSRPTKPRNQISHKSFYLKKSEAVPSPCNKYISVREKIATNRPALKPDLSPAHSTRCFLLRLRKMSPHVCRDACSRWQHGLIPWQDKESTAVYIQTSHFLPTTCRRSSRTNRKSQRRRLVPNESATQRPVQANRHVTPLASTCTGALRPDTSVRPRPPKHQILTHIFKKKSASTRFYKTT